MTEEQIILLGKPLDKYPGTSYTEEAMEDCREYSEHNKDVYRRRLEQNFEKTCQWDLFVMDGNEFRVTQGIIARVRLCLQHNILSDEEWKRAIPIIERGLQANKAYVAMLDEMAPIMEKYFSEYKDLQFRFTFHQRINLEMWQGRFCCPGGTPNYI